mgnify:CR=1 FL=1
MSAASRAKRVDPSIDVVVLERGDAVSIGACGFPYYLEGKVAQPGDLAAYSAERLREERGIQIRTGVTVRQIRHSRRELVLTGGETLAYDRLVIATGARPDCSVLGQKPPQNAFTLHSLADAVRLREFVEREKPRRAVVIGAGYIGLEVADVLARRGLEITVFEKSQYVLGREDAELTRAVAAELAALGIKLRLGSPVRQVSSNQVEDTGCDLIVAAAGILPNVELAVEAGVLTGVTGAIAVDEHMETNLAGVYAAGDCAEAWHVVTGRPCYIPLGTTANRMGRIAGACAAGVRESFRGVAGTSIVRIGRLGFAMTGLSLAEARRSGFDPVSVMISALDRPKYFQGRETTVMLVADRPSRRLLGGWVCGSSGVAGRIDTLAAALSSRMRAGEFEQLDLAYTPPFAPAADPLLVAARRLVKLLN